MISRSTDNQYQTVHQLNHHPTPLWSVDQQITVCVCECLSIIIILCRVIFVYVDAVYWFYGWFSFFFLMLTWMFQHDCLDTYCFWVSYMHAFSIFVFAPVQRNWACFTWKSALEIPSLQSAPDYLPSEPSSFTTVIIRSTDTVSTRLFINWTIILYHCDHMCIKR